MPCGCGANSWCSTSRGRSVGAGPQNWACSVLPSSASVDAVPPEITVATWSKSPAPTSRWWRVAL